MLTLERLDVAALDHVEQTARRGDQKVDAAADGLDLRLVADAAVDGDDAAAGLLGERVADLFDLAGELARRCDHQRMRRDGAAVTVAGAPPAGLPSMSCRIGRTKAAVLPVPVCAQPTTSRPARTRGIACSWIGVGRS